MKNYRGLKTIWEIWGSWTHSRNIADVDAGWQTRKKLQTSSYKINRTWTKSWVNLWSRKIAAIIRACHPGWHNEMWWYIPGGNDYVTSEWDREEFGEGCHGWEEEELITIKADMSTRHKHRRSKWCVQLNVIGTAVLKEELVLKQ